MPDLIRHPEMLKNTEFQVSPEWHLFWKPQFMDRHYLTIPAYRWQASVLTLTHSPESNDPIQSVD